MVFVHSKLRYAGPPRFGGVLRPGDEVLHLVSDARTEAAQRAELGAFVGDAELPRSLLNNPHFAGPGRPHLDVWGEPAGRVLRLLAAGADRGGGRGRTGRRSRAYMPLHSRRDLPDCAGRGGRSSGPCRGTRGTMSDIEEREAAPYLDKVRCWMVDVHGGNENELPPLDLRAVSEFLALGASALDRKGALVAAVREVMQRFKLTDWEMGADCWTLGCHCTCLEARRLVGELRDRFERALRARLIRIEVHPWAMRWKGGE